MKSIEAEKLLNIDNYPGLLPKDLMEPFINNVKSIFNELSEDSYARKPLDTYIRLANYYKNISDKDSTIIQYALFFCNDLKECLNHYVKYKYPMYDIQIETKGRIKSPSSALKKFITTINDYTNKGKDLDKLTVKDLFAFRFVITVSKNGIILDDNIAIPICYDVVEQAIEFTKKYPQIETVKSSPRSDKNAPIVHDNVTKPKTRPAYIEQNEDIIRDYIFYPKRDSNYQSAHTKLKISIPDNEDLFLEMQIRTYDMNEHAEHGPASHLAYKSRNIMSFSRVPQIFEENSEKKLEFIETDAAFKEFFGASISDIIPNLTYDFLIKQLQNQNHTFQIGLLQIEKDENGNLVVADTPQVSTTPIEIMNKNNNDSLEAVVLNIFTPEKEKRFPEIDELI